MSAFISGQSLAATGTTGNNTHAGAKLAPGADKIAAVVIIEAVGATPTVTFKLQGSYDLDTVADGSANWFDLATIPAATATEAATQVQTAVGAWPAFVVGTLKFCRRIRLVTSLNTNVTYRGELHQQYAH